MRRSGCRESVAAAIFLLLGLAPVGAQESVLPAAGARTYDVRRAIVEPDRLSPLLRSPPRAGVGSAAHTAACDPLYRQIRSGAGAALVEALRRADEHCIDDLEWIGDQPEVQFAASSERHLIDVANAIPGLMASYGNGSERQREIYRLFLYLRKVRDIHYWCREWKTCDGAVWEDAEAYPLEGSSPAGAALRGAFDAFVAHPLFLDRSRQHAIVLDCAAIAMFEFPLQEHYLHVTSTWLRAWDDDYAASIEFRDAMERILDIPYWGHRRPEAFGPAFGRDAELFGALRDFVLDASWLGGPSQRILERATLESARFGLYEGTANYDRLPAFAQAVRERWAGVGRGRGIWLRFVGELLLGDTDDCSRYGLCSWYEGGDFHAGFRRELFGARRSCALNYCADDSVALHAQALSAAELDTACDRLFDHGGTFQSMLGTQCRPVPDDANRHLDIFVFADGASCEDMESAAFGGFPDSCSGIYWEGDPSDPSAVSTFVATEKEPGDPRIDPELAIWNFEHEYAPLPRRPLQLAGRLHRSFGPRRVDRGVRGVLRFRSDRVPPRRGVCVVPLVDGYVAAFGIDPHELQPAPPRGPLPDGVPARVRRSDSLAHASRRLRRIRDVRCAGSAGTRDGLGVLACRRLHGCRSRAGVRRAEIGDLILIVGEQVALELPEAWGGDGPLAYALKPEPPPGLEFGPTSRRLSGTPLDVAARTDYVYTATDSDAAEPDVARLPFTIAVLSERPDPEPPEPEPEPPTEFPGWGETEARPADDDAVLLTWTGDWVSGAVEDAFVEARSRRSGWAETARVDGESGRVRVGGLEAGAPYTFRLRADLASGDPAYSAEASAVAGVHVGPCRGGTSYLCLQGGRFEVQAHWSNPERAGDWGVGAALRIDESDESGLFWFFEPENIELVVKVLDGRAINGSHWVFFGSLSDVEYWVTVRDAMSGGASRTWHNPPKVVCGQNDTAAFRSLPRARRVRRSRRFRWGPIRRRPPPRGWRPPGRRTIGQRHTAAPPARSGCACWAVVSRSRFVSWTRESRRGADPVRAGKVVVSAGSPKTGFFWFFDPGNVELAVKMLDGGAVNGHYWFLYGGLSDVEYDIDVTDMATGRSAKYENEAGSQCGEIDTTAFAFGGDGR